MEDSVEKEQVVIAEETAEKVLIEQAQAGDIAAFESLIEQHQKKIYNLALQLTNDHAQAQDIAQDALVKAFRSISKFQMDSAFSTWLYRIVRNVFLDDLKKSYSKHDKQYVSLDDKHDYLGGVSEDISEIEILKNVVHQSLEKLPIKMRTALLMFELQGFSYEEIGVIERTTIGTVKSRISKARKKLAKDPNLKRYSQNIGLVIMFFASISSELFGESGRLI